MSESDARVKHPGQANLEYGGAAGGWGSLKGIAWSRARVRCRSPTKIERAGLRKGQTVSLVSDTEGGAGRSAGLLKITLFKLQDGCATTYYPEMNLLVTLSNHDLQSKTPATKSNPVKICA